MEISLRGARLEEAVQLAGLVQAAYGPYVDRLGGPPRPMTDDYPEVVARNTVLVAERDGELVGWSSSASTTKASTSTMLRCTRRIKAAESGKLSFSRPRPLPAMQASTPSTSTHTSQ